MSRGDGLTRVRQALEDHGTPVRGGSARCPAHEDTNPSLSVQQGASGAVIHCHAGCDPRDVLAALGLSWGDLFDDPRSRRKGFEVTGTYLYTDEHGEVLFCVERRFPKDFRQYRLVNGRKVWNLNGVRRVPYRLPDLIEAALFGQPVYICEGEKDADAVAAAGAVATCNPGGAGKWLPEFSRYLDGAGKVVIIADKDRAGYAHAADVAASAGTVAETEIVQAAEGKDASDHLAAGYGLEDLAPVARQSLLRAKEAKEAKEARAADQAPPDGCEESAKEVPPDVPVADPGIFHGILGDITRAAAPGTEADPVGILGSLLAMTGVAVGRNPHVQVGNTRHPLLIWALLLGRTGSGRKGEATGTAALFARQAFGDDYRTWATSGLSSGEGLIERVRDGDGDKDQGIADKRLIVAETEFGTVMARAARDGSTLAEVTRQAWNGEPLSVLNRRRLSASWSHIAVIGHIAPKDFRRRLAAADLAGGTYNRYLPLFVERSKRLPVPEGADPKTVADLGGRLGEAVSAARKKTRVQLDGDAEALWRGELYDEFTEADDEEKAWAEFTRRAAPYCLRVAGLYAVLDGRDTISKDDLAAAAALVRYSAASARYVLGDLLRDPRMDRLTREITAAGDAGMTRTQVSALFGRHVSAEALGEMLRQLLDSGGFEVIENASGGRPAQAYRKRRP